MRRTRGDVSLETNNGHRETRTNEIGNDPDANTSATGTSKSATSQVLSRRELLKNAGIVGAAAALPLPALSGIEAQPKAPAAAAEPAATLSPRESETLKAIVARIIPADENGPGALEARADRYIDRALAGALASSRPLYATGLGEVDAYAQSSKGAPFAKLSASDQDAVLADMQDNRATGFTSHPSQFFDLVRTHTIQGTFADPFYGGNANFVGWDLIGYPGSRIMVTSADQHIETKPKSNHKSAYDYGMFTKGTI